MTLRGSNPSARCRLSDHQHCVGIVGAGKKLTSPGVVFCTCRCHGPRGYVPPKQQP